MLCLYVWSIKGLVMNSEPLLQAYSLSQVALCRYFWKSVSVLAGKLKSSTSVCNSWTQANNGFDRPTYNFSMTIEKFYIRNFHQTFRKLFPLRVTILSLPCNPLHLLSLFNTFLGMLGLDLARLGLHLDTAVVVAGDRTQ